MLMRPLALLVLVLVLPLPLLLLLICCCRSVAADLPLPLLLLLIFLKHFAALRQVAPWLVLQRLRDQRRRRHRRLHLVARDARLRRFQQHHRGGADADHQLPVQREGTLTAAAALLVALLVALLRALLLANFSRRSQWSKNCNFGHNKQPTHCSTVRWPPPLLLLRALLLADASPRRWLRGPTQAAAPRSSRDAASTVRLIFFCVSVCIFCVFLLFYLLTSLLTSLLADWWRDDTKEHAIANLTWPTIPNDAEYLADSFSRLVVKQDAAGHKPFLAQISFHNCHDPFIGGNKTRRACQSGETCAAEASQPGLGHPGNFSDTQLDYYAWCVSLFFCVCFCFSCIFCIVLLFSLLTSLLAASTSSTARWARCWTCWTSTSTGRTR